MSEQQQQSDIPIYQAQEPSDESKRVNAAFDEIQTNQIDNLDDSGKSIIERIATFLGVLFGISVLNSNFPPSYLKNNTAKSLVIVTLACFFLSIIAAVWATQVRYYNRYTHNVTRSAQELQRIVQHKVRWLRVANLLFALGALGLAVLLIVIVWNV